MCKVENIKEATLVELNASLLYQMGIPVGHAVLLTNVITDLKVRLL